MPPSQRQPDSPERTASKPRLRQPAMQASKKARGQQATNPHAAALALPPPSAQPASLPPPPQLPALEAWALPDRRVVETSRGMPWETSRRR